MKRVIIKKNPGFSKATNSGWFPQYYPRGEWSTPDTQTRDTLQPVPRDEANMEAERSEVIHVPNVHGGSATYNVGGNRHSSGGTPLSVPPDSFVFSDTRSLKIGGPVLENFGKSSDTKKKFTPADLAKQYDINKFRKLLEDPLTKDDPLVQSTGNQMIGNYEKKLGQLALTQEALKSFPDGIPEIAIPYLQSTQTDPSQVLPLSGTPGSPGNESLGEGHMKYGGNPWQNGAMGFGQDGGSFTLAPTKYDFRPEYAKEKARQDWIASLTNSGILTTKGQAGDPLYSPTLGIPPVIPSPLTSNSANHELAYNTPVVPNTVPRTKTTTTSTKSVAGISAWAGDRTNKSNASKYNSDQWKTFAQTYCKDCKTNEDVQKFILSNPEFKPQIDALHEKYGMPLAGKEVDGKLGHRWDFVFDHPAVAPVIAAKAKTPSEIPVGYHGPYNNASPDNPFYLQDTIGTLGAAGDFMRIKKYLPWGAPVTPYVPDPVFYDPTRELASNAEQMNIGTQGASTFSGPQQFNSRFSEIQGHGAANAANILGKYNNENVGVANQFAGIKTQAVNQANQYNAFNAKDLYDKTTIANQNFDNSKNMARQELRQHLMDAITNKSNAQVLNSLYPNYQIHPEVGGDLGFVHGDQMLPSGQGNQPLDIYDSYIQHGLSPENAIKLIQGEDKDQYNDARIAYLQSNRGIRGKKKKGGKVQPSYGYIPTSY